MILSMLCILFNIGFLIAGAVMADAALLTATVSSIFMTIFNFAAILFVFGALDCHHRTKEHPLFHWQKGSVLLHLPAVHADLHPHRCGSSLQEN